MAKGSVISLFSAFCISWSITIFRSENVMILIPPSHYCVFPWQLNSGQILQRYMSLNKSPEMFTYIMLLVICSPAVDHRHFGHASSSVTIARELTDAIHATYSCYSYRCFSDAS